MCVGFQEHRLGVLCLLQQDWIDIVLFEFIIALLNIIPTEVNILQRYHCYIMPLIVIYVLCCFQLSLD